MLINYKQLLLNLHQLISNQIENKFGKFLLSAFDV